MTKADLIYALSEGVIKNVALHEAYYLKIGFTSTGSAESRCSSCQTGNPRPLNVFRTYVGPQSHESEIHKLLHRFRQRGEWFLVPGHLVRRMRFKRIETSQELIAALKKAGCSQHEWLHWSFRGAERDFHLKDARAHGEQLIDSRAQAIRRAVADLRAAVDQSLAEVDQSLEAARKAKDPFVRQKLVDQFLDLRSEIKRKGGL